MNKRNTSIAIVGAGLMGRLAAVALSRQGYAVTLFDKDDQDAHQSAAYAAAGLLTPLGEAMHSEANIVEMGFASIEMWPQILDSLSGYTYFQQEGALMVSHEQDQGDYLRYARFLKNHFSEYEVQHLNRQQMLTLEPELGRSFSQGMFLPQEGQLGNRKLLVALTEEIQSLDIEWLTNTRVEAMRKGANDNEGYQVTFNQQTRDFDLVIDTRGSGARANEASQSNAPLKDLRAVRGEVFQLFAPDVHLNRPVRLMHPRYQLYIAPKTKGFYVVGATEIESDDTSPMTVRSAMELLSAAYSVHPGFAEANIRQHISQLRPAFSDNQPRVSVNSGLIQVNGLYRHGFLIAPVVLEQLLHAVSTHFGKASEPRFQHLLPIQVSHEYIY